MLQDFHCDTAEEAMEELRRRKAAHKTPTMVHRMEHSPYSGYTVRSTDADIYVDELVDGPAVLTERSTSFGRPVRAKLWDHVAGRNR